MSSTNESKSQDLPTIVVWHAFTPSGSVVVMNKTHTPLLCWIFFIADRQLTQESQPTEMRVKVMIEAESGSFA